MNAGKTVFSQIMSFLPMYEFRKCIQRYRGDYKVRGFTCLDLFLCMAFAQLTYRESLRDIETCLRSIPNKLYHLGIRGRICRSTLADANEKRDWRIYAEFAQVLIRMARELYVNEPFGAALKTTAYAFDATIIHLCLSLFPWSHFRKKQGAIKLHTLMDLRGNIPSFILITPAKRQEVTTLDDLIPEPGSFYILDRGYLDFSRLYTLHQAFAFFVIRSKEKIRYQRLYSHPVDKATGLRSDQTVIPKVPKAAKDYPEKLRRIRFYDAENKKISRLYYKQFPAPSSDDYAALQMPLAGRAFLQMDQATPAHSSILWHFRKCRQNTSMGCNLRLCARRHYQKTTRLGYEPLHNSTDIEHFSF